MMTHQQQHHLLDLSSPAPNAAMLASFDHGLLALHDGADVDYHRHHHMPGGGVVLAGAAPWPQQPASLSLYNAGAGAGLPSSSFQLVGHHHQLAAFAAAPPVAAMAAAVQPFQLRGSRYLGPVKELLAEFCSLGEGDLQHAMDGSKRAPKKDDVDVGSSLSSPWANLSLSSMDLLDLERRKTRLLSMVEEVDRRYRRYREQIRAVEVSFEAMVGGGAAQVYTKLALRAMSRHFRCLRDALVAQVRVLSKAMGERDTAGGVAAAAAPGATKGDTPRLRVLDQCLRQQRAFQQSGAIDSFPWRPQRGLPERAVAILRAWLFEHFLHPYPNDVDKHILARQTGLSRSQVSNWFINARVRLWKPMIEDMYKEEIEPEESDAGNKNGSAIAGAAGAGKQQHGDHNMIKTTSSSTTTAATTILGRQKISHRQLRGGNPNSLMIRPPSSSIVASADDVVGSHVRQFLAGQSHLHGGAVSLTLGLQQQQPLMASPAMTMHQQSPLMQLDAAAEAEEEAVVLPYRNLMGSHSQLLHDFAG